MNNIARIFTAIALLLLTSPAFASDFRGFASLFIAIPAMIISNVILGACFAFRASRHQKIFAVLIFAPVIAASAACLGFDALPLASEIKPKDPNDHGISFFVGYIILFAFLTYLLKRIVSRPIPSMRNGL
ncbi:hypothetical protein [Xanthomonas arboricola]|uniref:hypothetical protein n=1 Tax=Xanthomonas arboricola TaxID=56448 RepID=UPI000B07EA89|nr:hypothetical protein [Xanthomonas arboricola]NIK51696.1 hypothetical protein [Xanthomonas arboricola]